VSCSEEHSFESHVPGGPDPAPNPAEPAEKTIDYAEAKTAYFKALRDELPEIMKIATGKEEWPPELDTFAAAFAVAGEDQAKAADEETLVLIKRFPSNPDVEKAWAEFERAQKLEEQFHKDFDRVDITGTYLPDKGFFFIPPRNKPFSLGPRGDIYRVGTFAQALVSILQGSREKPRRSFGSGSDIPQGPEYPSSRHQMGLPRIRSALSRSFQHVP
jgi:hypothetical protein